jgi:hypothetical protein
MEFYREWRIGKGGFVWEREIPQEEQKPEPRSRQQELFAV